MKAAGHAGVPQPSEVQRQQHGRNGCGRYGAAVIVATGTPENAAALEDAGKAAAHAYYGGWKNFMSEAARPRLEATRRLSALRLPRRRAWTPWASATGRRLDDGPCQRNHLRAAWNPVQTARAERGGGRDGCQQLRNDQSGD